MHQVETTQHYGNLESWFDLLKVLGASRRKTRGEMAQLTGTTYNTFCRLLRNHLIPMGIVKREGFSADPRIKTQPGKWAERTKKQGRPTDTYRMTSRGMALLAALEHIEEKYGAWDQPL